MNRLPIRKRMEIIEHLVDGSSVRATSRLTDTSLETVLKLLRDVGQGCLEWHDHAVRNVSARKVQADEAWQFCYAKDKTLENGRAKSPPPEAGTFWTWAAIEQRTKLLISWMCSPTRGYEPALEFMYDLRSRLANRIELSTDGHDVYARAVEKVFGSSIDYGQVVKHYDSNGYTGSTKIVVMGDPKHITTSHVERMNLHLRTDMRRYTRRGVHASKKMENHIYALAMYFVYYNFCKSHSSFGSFTTPAMASGITDRQYGLEWMADLGTGDVGMPEVPEQVRWWEPASERDVDENLNDRLGRYEGKPHTYGTDGRHNPMSRYERDFGRPNPKNLKRKLRKKT